MTTAERLNQISETEWCGFVASLAALNGWAVVNTADSRRANAGWPVFVAVRDGRMVIAQLKSEANKVTPAQQRWLDDLGKVAAGSGEALSVFLWRPSDRVDVEKVLS